ncbi:acetyl-CoA synthase subunit gamma [Geomonas sp. Red875]|uniref:Acetyl-CoA synthase subunit gamma n=2 Tax=Geomesophilobacter sediminis TaxID=2798584 RepID=A0A8J7M2Y6_9BACT|nr:acetyl-CoA synthase subunit gamma [Geomesophilobacter sediminis]
MHYLVPPGLYALGNPTPESPVLVTANYKMSFDAVRSELGGHDVWLLVLETYGINVWCAAGKGTFGTEELVNRIRLSRLDQFVSHRRLILPILGAPGVAAHEVTRQTGFAVRYATLRAADLPEYLANGAVTTARMREITFSFYERLVLIPVEVMLALKPIAWVGAVLFALFYAVGGLSAALTAFGGYFGACLTGIAVTPALLPWLPGRSFALKGAVAGVIYTACFYLGAGGASWGWPLAAAAFFAFPAFSSFYGLNFTGCTTYTSRSGVKKEMRLSLPVMAGSLAVSLLLVVAAWFV